MPPLEVLIAEDDVADAELIARQLERSGYQVQWTRVDTKEAFLQQLNRLPDIVLADYAMPQFGGLDALALLRASGLDIPLILVSGTVGEELAVEAMRFGATDYLLKDRIARLGNAVERALAEKRLRADRNLAQEQIQIQLRELRRWQAVTLDREDRVQALKREVNELLRTAGRAPRYSAAETGEAEAPA